jgi:hypothetical protein
MQELGFTPDPNCDNCDGTGWFEPPASGEDGTPCHFCLSDAIRRGELDGVADGVKCVSGVPVEN